MWQGTVVSINITPEKHGNLQAVDQVEAQAGCGLVGDRFFFQDGVSKGSRRGYQVTLIEREAIEAANQDYEIPLEPRETRRNLITQGVALNHLVGKTFFVGSVQLKGVSLCEPCSHLQSLTRPGVMKSLIHRGGLRAEILNDGMIQVGDVIQGE